MTAGSGDTGESIARWFGELQACVREVDFARARSLFAEDVVSFGTVAGLVSGVGSLEAHQWRNVWPNIREFTFDLPNMRWGVSGDLAWAVATWHSQGFHPDGTPFERPGRATVIFAYRDGRWRGIHTHFSLYPGVPQKSILRP